MIVEHLDIKEDENMSLKNKTSFGEWLSLAGETFRRDKFIKGKDLLRRFDDWIYRECGIKKQRIYKNRNLYKLMSFAPKLLDCRVNVIYFVKNYGIHMAHLENEGQIPWKNSFNCKCNDCKSYFFGMEF